MESAGVMAVYRMLGPMGKVNHIRQARRRYPNTKFANFGMKHVYPWDCRQISEMTTNLHTTVPKITCGIHWYAGSSQAQKLNAELDETTVGTHHSTVAHFLRKAMQ